RAGAEFEFGRRRALGGAGFEFGLQRAMEFDVARAAHADRAQPDAFDAVAEGTRFFDQHRAPLELFRDHFQKTFDCFAAGRHAVIGGEGVEHAFAGAATHRVRQIAPTERLAGERADARVFPRARAPADDVNAAFAR